MGDYGTYRPYDTGLDPVCMICDQRILPEERGTICGGYYEHQECCDEDIAEDDGG